MNDTVAAYQREGQVAVIRLSNPPVNGLSYHLRAELSESLDRAISDDAVKAILLIGKDAYFSCGADIREFNTPNSRREPTTPNLIKRIEQLTKPVVAAIHGAALGGGLELALGCHYRVAESKAKLGLPEVKLGLLPGGGGTQRLPRLIGIASALDIIVGGKPIDAWSALRSGLIDAVGEENFEQWAIGFAAAIAERPLAMRRLPERAELPSDAAQLFAAARERARKEMRGQKAPLECIACVEKSTSANLEDGLRFEREQFVELVEGTESKAMRHLFFAERQVAKLTHLTGDATERPLTTVGVVGAGTMGSGIAMAFASAGFPVTLVDATQEALDRGLHIIRKNYAGSVAKGKLSQLEMDERVGRVRGATDMVQLGNADLIVEAVFEEMEVKRSVFEKLDRIAKPGAILATNTSRLDINQIAQFTARPADVIGLHFFSPAHVMRLLEIVRGDATAPDVIQTVVAMAKQIGKIGVVVGVCDGFVGNRMVSLYTREAHFLLEEGASPEQVDKAVEGFGMAMGPLRMGDLAGLDISWAMRKRLAPTRPAHIRYCKIADRICEAGRLGQKTGAGFYRYEPGSRTPIADPEIDRLIETCAVESGIVRREISNEEIIERTMYALINEGARILEDGIAQRGSDIDVIYVNGYGFPAARGGPMFYADTIGLDRVLARVREYHQLYGELWAPAPLLERLVQDGGRLSDYEAAAPKAEPKAKAAV